MRAVSRGAAAASLIAAAVLVASCTTDGQAIRKAGEPPVSTGVAPESSTTSSAPSSPGSPRGVDTVDNAFRITAAPGQPRVIVTIVEDMACPACATFEEVYGADVDAYATDPQVAVDFHIISFLDRMSPDEYSSRAANASHCVWRDGPSATRAATWRKFQHAAFGAQPDEGGPGLPDARLVALAAEAGAPGAAACITGGERRSAVESTTSRIMDEPDFRGTPTVLVNGAKVDLGARDALRRAVDAAK